jgi:hypothetical protein
MGEAPDAVSAGLICLPILLPNLLFRDEEESGPDSNQILIQ